MKRWILIGLGAALLGGAGYAYTRMAPRKSANLYANLPREAVQHGRFVVTIEEMGVVSAERREPIRPPFDGRIVKLMEDGTAVEKGEPVAWMDIEKAQDNLQEQINQLRQIKADLQRNVEDIRMSLDQDFLDLQSAAALLEFNQLKLTDVNRDLMTLEALADSQLATERDIDRSKLQVESSKLEAVTSDLDYRGQYANHDAQKTIKSLQLGQLQHRRDKAMNKIDEEQNKLNLAIVRAPISGVFLIDQGWEWSHNRSKPVSVGDQRDEDELIGSIPDLSSLVVASQISESAVTQVKPGARATITLDAFPDLTLEGEVFNVGLIAIGRERSAAGRLSQSEETSGLKVFEVCIRFDSIDNRLRPGMTANVSILISEKDDAIFVPFRCVFNKGGRKIAYVSTADGYEARQIVLGPRNRASVIVRKGLEPGERIFTLDLEPTANLPQPEESAAAGPPPMAGGGMPGGGGGPGGGGPGGGGPKGGGSRDGGSRDGGSRGGGGGGGSRR